MNISVDPIVCQGHAQCEECAPALFEVREDGLAYVRRPADTPDLLAQARDAAGRCPTDAISLDA
jgi:ferredoxin